MIDTNIVLYSNDLLVIGTVNHIETLIECVVHLEFKQIIQNLID